MTSDKTPIYYALNNMAFLGTKGVTVSLSVKKDGSFDMTVNPHLLGMIDDGEEDDEEIDDVKDKERNQRYQLGWHKNGFDSLMKEIQDDDVFDVVPRLKAEMRFMLEEEIARRKEKEYHVVDKIAHGIAINQNIRRMIMKENQDKDDQK